MDEKKIVTASSDWDWEIAREYMDKAVSEGRTEDDGLWDYLATFGISSPKENEAFLRKFDDETNQSFERLEGYLEEIKRLARAAQKKYAGV
jgi:hypothetical protein